MKSMSKLPISDGFRMSNPQKRARTLGRWSSVRRWELGVVIVLLALTSACAKKVAPSVPTAPKYAEFVYPSVPARLQASSGTASLDRGWRYLQNDDLGSAAREFGQALKLDRGFYPARAGEGYVALARRDYDKAVAAFDATLTVDKTYVPAFVGRGQALLGLKREAEALTTFEQALTLDSTLVDLRRRVELLRFRNVQDLIERARASAAAGRNDEARAAYERAIAITPESAFLYRELGMIERRVGDADRALEHLRKAAELDPNDAGALVEIGGILESRQQFDAAVASYRSANALEPSTELGERITAATAKARDARLPAEFKAIGQSPQITRGELAALLGIRLEPLLAPAATRQIVVTDVRTHWAAPWITTIVNAGILDAFENHTFQPQGRVRRADLATAVSRVVGLIAQRRPDLRQKMAERPRVADMSTGHLNYPAVAVAVSTGVLTLSDGRFQVSRQVTGAEAIEAVTRLQALAGNR
jgi:tetratricopeptide (TPR) repeat protein